MGRSGTVLKVNISATCNAKRILKYSWDVVSESCKTSIFHFLIWVFVIADLAPYMWAEIKYFVSVSWCICCDNVESFLAIVSINPQGMISHWTKSIDLNVR